MTQFMFMVKARVVMAMIGAVIQPVLPRTCLNHTNGLLLKSMPSNAHLNLSLNLIVIDNHILLKRLKAAPLGGTLNQLLLRMQPALKSYFRYIYIVS